MVSLNTLVADWQTLHIQIHGVGLIPANVTGQTDILSLVLLSHIVDLQVVGGLVYREPHSVWLFQDLGNTGWRDNILLFQWLVHVVDMIIKTYHGVSQYSTWQSVK